MVSRLSDLCRDGDNSNNNVRDGEEKLLTRRPCVSVMTEVEKDTLKRRIFLAARDGMATMVFTLLKRATSKMEEESEYVGHMTHDDGHHCSPLIIAAINGHSNVVKMLLHHFQPDVEEEGTVVVDGYLIRGATALWCAAGAGHFNVVKCLIAHGADVNHCTFTNSTPLRAACFDGRLDIVRYLVEHGADVHVANKYNNTCLMISAFRGHLDVVKYLISQNIDLDARAQCGATSLHFAAEHGHLDIVKELLKSGAKITKDKIGMSPLIAAAERTKASVVEYLIDSSWFTNAECIEALELLGASFANDKDHYSLEKAFYYMEQAMKLRLVNPDLFLPKKCLPPMPAYDNRIESQTMEELQSIRHDLNALHMESLVIRERILGTKNPELPHPIIFRGAVFADVGLFDRCINLWLHALRLKHSNEISVTQDLLRFAQVFSQMLHIGEDVSLHHLRDVLTVAVEEVEKNVQFAGLDNGDVCTNALEELSDNMHSILYLLVVSTKIIKKYPPEEEHEFHRLVYRINRLNLATQNGSSLLHLAVSTYTPVDDFHTRNVCKFPCAATTKMLIQCGADVNAIDHAGNTPLHIIVAYQKPITDFMTLHSIINQLVDAGTHADCVNNNGETPADVVLTGVAEIILKAQYSFSLQCLAAKAVRKYRLPYEKVIPKSLIPFTDMHGAPRK